MRVKVFGWGTEKGLEDMVNKWIADQEEADKQILNANAHTKIIDIKFSMTTVGNEDGFSEFYGAMILYK